MEILPNNYYYVGNINDVLKDVKVYNLATSFAASKYPMLVDVEDATNDLTDTIRKLGSCRAGSGHDQFLTGIAVTFDLTFTIKAWTEAQRYNFLNFISSQSTMHRIMKMDIDGQCNDYVLTEIIKHVSKLLDKYNAEKTEENFLRLVYNVPVGLRLTAGMITNYRQLKTIYAQRYNHRLPEWREFCDGVLKLPYFKEVVLGEKNK